MPEPDDNSQAAAYLTKIIYAFRPPLESPQSRVWLNVYETSGSRSYQAECPVELATAPDLIRGWAAGELRSVGVKVDTWETPPDWRGWDEGEFDYRAVGVEVLPQLPAQGTVWVTATATTWGDSGSSDDYEQEHGWVQPQFSRTTLYENRDDVAPIYSGTDPAAAASEIRDFLGGVEQPESGRGSFYASDSESSLESGTSYSYACHAEGWSPEQLKQIEQQVQQHPHQAWMSRNDTPQAMGEFHQQAPPVPIASRPHAR